MCCFKIYRLLYSSDVGGFEIFLPLLWQQSVVMAVHTHFSSFFVEVTLALNGVCGVVMVMVSGVEHELNVCAWRDERKFRVALAAACLEPELALVLWTVTEACVSHFAVAMQALEQIVTFKLFLLIWHDARHFENISRLWWLVELHRIEGNHPSQRRVVHHVHVHHFDHSIDWIHAFNWFFLHTFSRLGTSHEADGFHATWYRFQNSTQTEGKGAKKNLSFAFWRKRSRELFKPRPSALSLGLCTSWILLCFYLTFETV